MRIDFPRLPIGELLIGFLLVATIVTFVAALFWQAGGRLERLTGSPTPVRSLPEQGQEIVAVNGCLSCHSTTGQVIVGPSWKGLFGKSQVMADGSTVVVDHAYIRESIQNPTAKVVKDFAAVMPSFSTLDEQQIQAIIAYIQSVE